MNYIKKLFTFFTKNTTTNKKQTKKKKIKKKRKLKGQKPKTIKQNQKN